MTIHKSRNGSAISTRWGDEELIRNAIESSSSIKRAIEKIGAHPNSKSYRRFHEACASMGIDFSFPNKFKTTKFTPESVLHENFPKRRNVLVKKIVIENGFLDNECSICKLGPEWNGVKLVLQLDHINGIYNDNRIENLRILCPNCHSQTATYAGKNARR